MKELSIFVDESGDFGQYDFRTPYYIISMVMHEQNVDISDDLKALEGELNNIGWSNHCVHAGPVIRSEEEYRGYAVKDRQKILMKMMAFIRHMDISFKSIYISRKSTLRVLLKLQGSLVNSCLHLFVIITITFAALTL